MNITRTELIKICDRFLEDKISKEEMIHFATSVMFDDEDKYECDDEIVEEILAQWDNVHTQHKINKLSIQFLRNTLSELN
ncbi:hypothetical protein [Epilithonimonas lactis]|uniref:Uncharacterized protein n=1 Tax=Epilithonimonas lactis TaxID=421072 RepID=A0A085BJB7_9FLAO|nr:hypothetical protein [Epilithonimonas lactis]KFC22562.1 hypothetical protein IO89_05775 [Epilithonimonas lactis]WDF46159.1 hypothetical protein PQ459_14775 [Chryseobacterium sp. KACC 21268]SEQ80494.1 hypothetical protein SAMN04488097_3067 [Epilithonimonas lactis]